MNGLSHQPEDPCDDGEDPNDRMEQWHESNLPAKASNGEAFKSPLNSVHPPTATYPAGAAPPFARQKACAAAACACTDRSAPGSFEYGTTAVQQLTPRLPEESVASTTTR
jgi:hypothetical protein